MTGEAQVGDAAAIGVDVGGTRLRAAAVDADGRILQHEATERPSGEDPDAFGRELIDRLTDLLARLGPGVPVGIGVASVVGPDGVLVSAPNLPADGLPLGAWAREALEVPVTVVNDATAACLAEARVGAAVGVDDVLLVTVGTGVGGGAMVAGRLLRGAQGMAAEFGHLVVAEGGRRCECGNHGCLEAVASGRAIGEIAAERLAEGRTSDALAAEPVVDGESVSRAAEAGDRLAREVVDEAGRWLGIGLAGLVNAFDPALVLVGGGAGHALQDHLLPAARTAMATRVLGHQRRRLPPVQAAGLGDEAGVMGAALLAFDEAG